MKRVMALVMVLALMGLVAVGCGQKPAETPTETPATTAPPPPPPPETPAMGETPAGGETPAMGETPAPGETPAEGETPAAGEGAAAPMDAAPLAKEQAGYEDVMAMTIETTPEMVEKGKEIYAGAGQCTTCHGDAGAGDGPAGAALQPPPRNLIVASEYKYGSDAKGVYRTVYYGSKDTGMVANGDKVGGALTEDQVKEVTAYVLSLQK